MMCHAAARFLVMAVLGLASAGVLSPSDAAGSAQGAAYKVVQVCSLVPLAEVKKLAPWAPHLDALAKPEEEAIGTHGSSCNYPTFDSQKPTLIALAKAFVAKLH